MKLFLVIYMLTSLISQAFDKNNSAMLQKFDNRELTAVILNLHFGNRTKFIENELFNDTWKVKTSAIRDKNIIYSTFTKKHFSLHHDLSINPDDYKLSNEQSPASFGEHNHGITEDECTKCIFFSFVDASLNKRSIFNCITKINPDDSWTDMIKKEAESST